MRNNETSLSARSPADIVSDKELSDMLRRTLFKREDL